MCEKIRINILVKFDEIYKNEFIVNYVGRPTRICKINCGERTATNLPKRYNVFKLKTTDMRYFLLIIFVVKDLQKL